MKLRQHIVVDNVAYDLEFIRNHLMLAILYGFDLPDGTHKDVSTAMAAAYNIIKTLDPGVDHRLLTSILRGRPGAAHNRLMELNRLTQGGNDEALQGTICDTPEL